MNYIVDPMWFYWLQVLNNLSIFCMAVGASGCAIAMLGIIYTMMQFDGMLKIESEYKKYSQTMKKLKKFVIIFAIMFICGLIIPNKETMIQMKIAEYTTYDNLNAATDKIKEITDYIVEKMQEVK